VLAALTFALVVSGAASVVAEPAKERYYFELQSITPKPELKAEALKMATPRVRSELSKALAQHPQIVAKLDGAPDPKVDPDAYRSYLEKSNISGSFNVIVEITDASETFTPIADKPAAQQLETRLALRMLGTHIPDDTLGFTGRGKASVKQEVGTRVSEHDRQETWAQLSELAVSQAMKTALEELTLAAKTKAKTKSKSKSPSKTAPPAH
jgi:hypothetical protein